MVIRRRKLFILAALLAALFIGGLTAKALPAQVQGSGYALLQKAWAAGGAVAETYTARAYWRCSGNAQAVAELARGLGLPAGRNISASAGKSVFQTGARIGQLDVSVCATFFEASKDMVLLYSARAPADDTFMSAAEELLQKALVLRSGAAVYRQLSGSAPLLAQAEMSAVCARVFAALEAGDVQAGGDGHFVSALCYVPGEPAYLLDAGKRCNLQIALRAATTGKTNVVMGVPAILEGY